MLETSVNKLVVQMTTLNEKLDAILALNDSAPAPAEAPTDEPDLNADAPAPADDTSKRDDVSAKDVKKLAKELIAKKMTTRDKVKKIITKTGNHKISQMDQPALNTVYYTLMNVFTAAKKK